MFADKFAVSQIAVTIPSVFVAINELTPNIFERLEAGGMNPIFNYPALL